MITSIIFDLDGLLADTERLHCLAYQEALGAHGGAVTDHEYAEHWVRGGRGISEWISDRGLALDPLSLRVGTSPHVLAIHPLQIAGIDGLRVHTA